MSMDINTKPGSKIRFSYPDNGKPADKETAKCYLRRGTNYTLKNIAVDDFRTEVKLKEVPGVWFNSVHFDNINSTLNTVQP